MAEKLALCRFLKGRLKETWPVIYGPEHGAIAGHLLAPAAAARPVHDDRGTETREKDFTGNPSANDVAVLRPPGDTRLPAFGGDQ